MMKLPKLISLILMMTPFASFAGFTVPSTETINQTRQDVNMLADDYLEAYFNRYPEQATLLGIPQTRHDSLSDISLAALRDWRQKEDSLLARLDIIDSALLENSAEYVTYHQL